VTSIAQRQWSFWIVWLQVVLVLLFAYALVLVFAGSVAEAMFSALGFGPPDSIVSGEFSTYMKLPFMVLGAVMAGWAILMMVIVRGPLRAGSSWAVAALAGPLAVWFVLDTGMSVVLGFPTHAIFNIPFAIALGLPLWRLHVNVRPSS
jgi:hypothetical protein